MDAKRRRSQAKPLVEEWMTRDPYTVGPNDSVTHAIMLLEERQINQLPVVAGGVLVGIISDRDLRDAWTLVPSLANKSRKHRKRMASDEIPVNSLMTRAVLTVSPGDRLEKAALLMRSKRIGGLPVVVHDHVEGIITRSDVLDAFLAKKRHTNRTSAPSRSHRRDNATSNTAG